MASSTAPRRGSDVLLTTLDHPGAGVARDGGGEQREYAYYVFQDSCPQAICKEPNVCQCVPGVCLVLLLGIWRVPVAGALLHPKCGRLL